MLWRVVKEYIALHQIKNDKKVREVKIDKAGTISIIRTTEATEKTGNHKKAKS